MARISFSDGLAIGGCILAILLVVLDKADKLKGPALFALLGLAGCMALPLAFGNSWVADAPPLLKFARGAFCTAIVMLAYSLLALWIAPEKQEVVANASAEGQFLSPQLRGNIDYIFVCDDTTGGFRSANAYVRMELTNVGRSSAARSFHLTALVNGRLRSSQILGLPHDPYILRSENDGSTVASFRIADMLDEKANKPIAKEQSVKGWLRF